MKLKTACEIAKDCDLKTLGEAMLNISLHSMSIFDYGMMNRELEELRDDYMQQCKLFGYDQNTKIDELMNFKLKNIKKRNANDKLKVWLEKL